MTRRFWYLIVPSGPLFYQWNHETLLISCPPGGGGQINHRSQILVAPNRPDVGRRLRKLVCARSLASRLCEDACDPVNLAIVVLTPGQTPAGRNAKRNELSSAT